MKVINGDGLILGRVSAYAAKQALQGEQVHIINAEKMVISGDHNTIVQKYVKRRGQKNKANPEHSPHWPKRPDLLVKRVIRGMLPWDKPSGRAAHHRIRVYMGEMETKVKPVEFNSSYKKDKLDRYITVLELCRALAYRH